MMNEGATSEAAKAMGMSAGTHGRMANVAPVQNTVCPRPVVPVEGGGSVTGDPMNQNGSGDAPPPSFKELIESVKKLNVTGEGLLDCAAEMHLKMAEVIIMGATLFSPSATQMVVNMTGVPDEVKLEWESRDPGFSRQFVEENYERIITAFENGEEIKW